MTILNQIEVMWSTLVALCWSLSREEKIDWLVSKFGEDRHKLESLFYSHASIKDAEVWLNSKLTNYLLYKACEEALVFEKRGGYAKYYEFIEYLDQL